jgi:adenine-specific DNA glycosylase
VEGVKPYVKTVGLYNTKSKNLIELCRRIVEQHGGEIPRDREALEALPGVGRKTANVILNMVFGESTIAVDTHIFRVANRTGLAVGKNPLVVEHELNAVTPDAYRKDAHHWLLLHGRYVCTARLPACPRCIIADLCEFPLKTPPLDLPKSDAPVAHRKTAKRSNAGELKARGAGTAGARRLDAKVPAVKVRARSARGGTGNPTRAARAVAKSGGTRSRRG